jgi:hypothetical protein
LIGYTKISPSGRRFACKIGVFFQISRIFDMGIPRTVV